LEVPADFRQTSVHNKHLLECLHACPKLEETHSRNLNLEEVQSTSLSDTTTLSDQFLNQMSTTNLSSRTIDTPIVRAMDKPSSSLPKSITLSKDFIRASMGFRCIDTVKQHFRDLYQDSIKFDTLPPDAILDSGDLATLRKTPRNTTPVPRPESYGDVMHIDIVFGPEVAIGNFHYGLLFADQFSRMNYLYPLQNLTSDIKKQIEAFFAHIEFPPHCLISDFDLKLIGGKAREYLNSLLIHVNAAPANCQDRNGLAE